MNLVYRRQYCADCSIIIGQDDGPPDGWQLEDGRTVCNSCCLIDTHKLVHSEDFMTKLGKMMRENRRRKTLKWLMIVFWCLFFITVACMRSNAENYKVGVCAKPGVKYKDPNLPPCPNNNVLTLDEWVEGDKEDDKTLLSLCVKHEYSQNYPELTECPRELSNWYNMKTGEVEHLYGTPHHDRLREFISQSSAAQNLYNLYIEIGKTQYEAFELVLSATINQEGYYGRDRTDFREFIRNH